MRHPATERHRANWLDCIRNGKRPATDVELGYRSCTLCILGNMAYLLGRFVQEYPERSLGRVRGGSPAP